MLKALYLILFQTHSAGNCMELDEAARWVLCPQMPVSMGF